MESYIRKCPRGVLKVEDGGIMFWPSEEGLEREGARMTRSGGGGLGGVVYPGMTFDPGHSPHGTVRRVL